MVVFINIADLSADFIYKLDEIFKANHGDNTVSFEVLELEKVKRQVVMKPILVDEEGEFIDDENPEPAAVEVIEQEETKIITRLSMQSRKLKVNISNELLAELEKLQVKFKLN